MFNSDLISKFHEFDIGNERWLITEDGNVALGWNIAIKWLCKRYVINAYIWVFEI